MLFEIGQDAYDIVYVETGAMDVVDRATEHTITTIDTGNFVGEIGMLMGQRTFLAGVVSEAGRMIVVERDTLRELVATVPEIGDPVVSAFAARRRLLTEWGEGGLVIVGDQSDASAGRSREFATRNQIPHRWVDRADSHAIDKLEQTCELPPTGSAVVTGRSDVLADPTARDLAAAIGLDLVADTSDVFDTVTVGAGPAGLAAAVYAASERCRTPPIVLGC